jgi:hypothetical protein
MAKTVTFVAILGLAGAISVGALAQAGSGEIYAAKRADCEQQADAQNFGIHLSQRHRYLVRCIAGLPQR